MGTIALALAVYLWPRQASSGQQQLPAAAGELLLHLIQLEILSPCLPAIHSEGHVTLWLCRT